MSKHRSGAQVRSSNEHSALSLSGADRREASR